VDVCSVSGKIPTSNCHHKVKTWFHAGVSPIQNCDVHRQITVTRNSGKRACNSSKGPFDIKVFEVWPTHVMRAFEKIGVPRKFPPHYGSECSIEEKLTSGNDPQILSPKYGLTYTVRLDTKNDPIRLHVRTDADVKQVFWYLNDRFLGKISPQDSFFLKAESGQHVLRVVDDRGRTAERRLKVAVIQ
jgi:penicillin-binding protein 1C